MLLLHAMASFVYVHGPAGRHDDTLRALPPNPPPATRDSLFLIMGEQHHRVVPRRLAVPRWLVIPETGLYTGIAIVGAIGTGKTTACIYPYVEQFLAYRAGTPIGRWAVSFSTSKGDFARYVQTILTRCGRAQDYLGVSLDSVYRYNPSTTTSTPTH